MSTDSLNAIPQELTATGFPRDKKADRDRLERMYLTRQCTRNEFYAWLKAGGHHVGN